MRQSSKFRCAFTMIELVFTIVILGVVASIGAEVIAQTFESYIVQRAQYRANIKTELALNQVANRLRYAISDTIGARKTLTATYIPLNLVSDPDMNVLQWVGYDGDSFEAISNSADRKPGWSSFCDITASSSSTISTPGSNLDLASTIITNLGGSLGGSRIFFAEDNGRSYPISTGSGESITMNGIPSGSMIRERYKLAWSSYALEVDNNSDLWLYYQFTPNVPVPGADIPINGSKQLLLHNVTNFRFKYSGGAFRLKVCKREQISSDPNKTVHACKEKVVF